ncbi:MAG: adenine-specific methyltransferase EcoRI family protein [Clostridia bacterium]|nr:adenine-specific methyltransferase EcoRI family protein [Clostridia bacterium]
MPKAKNTNLNKAGINKEDEFYTKITDIERELRYYKHYFKDKTVFCNCDDPETSNFWKYFELQFEELGLKKLVSTHFDPEKPTYKLELMRDIDGDGKITKKDIIKTPLQQNGDFRSPECIEILKEADIIVTNPPFSLYTEYVKQLMDYNKKFVIIGRETVATNKYIFPLIKDGKIWTGYNNGDMEFVVPSYYEPRETRYREENGIKYRSLGNALWLTNLDIPKRHEDYKVYKAYREEDYLKFDYYDAIFVAKLTDIPCDYDGVMGVPITILHHHNPEQFEIVGLLAGNIRGLAGIPSKIDKDGPYVNGKMKFGRILIRNKRLAK